MSRNGQEEAKEWLLRMAGGANSAMAQVCSLSISEFDRMWSIHKANVGFHKRDHTSMGGHLKKKGDRKTPTRRSLYDCLAGCRQVGSNYDFYDDLVPHTSHGTPFLFPVTVEGAWRYGRHVGIPALQVNDWPDSQRGPQHPKWVYKFLHTPHSKFIRMRGRCIVRSAPSTITVQGLNIKFSMDPPIADRLMSRIGTPEGALIFMRLVQKAGKTGISCTISLAPDSGKLILIAS